ncbi:hypothetical protein AB2M62_12390 [Sphingomonas sp. MMS12-HWE2-04]|uniref:hypothetical protein n=1 Tax=Sphingomonas sp. MMS12-HWE2-04 TaxID=3234199 RepID=UPI00384D3528
MILLLSRAMMTLACRCLGETRSDWARAMQAEFEVAAEDGRPLRFAAGCLMGALRQMPAQDEGRFILTTYALALGIMIPMAAIQVGCAVFDLPYLFAGHQGLRGTFMVPGQEALIGGAVRAAVPSLTALQLLSGAGQLRIAWLMLERDWPRVASAGMAILAALATLILFMGALFLDARQAMILAAVLMIELAILTGLSRWNADLRLPPTKEPAA